ncbi:ATP-binding cassette domain-containing protein [Amedibacillus sp. YH-ame10]
MMLEMKDVRKQYDRFLLDCTLRIEEGRVVGLVGQNGAGKTTTFKAMLNLIDIDAGTISLFGKAHDQLSVEDKMKIGVVLSDAGFSEYLNVKGVLSIVRNLYKNFNETEFLKKCATFQIPMDKKIKDFSTGMKAKLKLIVAMSHDAKVLILDEPTAGLDVIARDELLDMLRGYMEDETHSILISSHISSDLESLCDDFYMIHNGKIVLHEDTDVLLSDYGILKVSEKQFQTLEKQYILKVKEESFGYRCLTKEKQFFMDNYPDIVVEKGTMDEMILMMVKGDSI